MRECIIPVADLRGRGNASIIMEKLRAAGFTIAGEGVASSITEPWGVERQEDGSLRYWQGTTAP